MELVQNKELTAAYRRRAEELVAQMTLEEKVMQTMLDCIMLRRSNGLAARRTTGGVRRCTAWRARAQRPFSRRRSAWRQRLTRS